MPRRWARAASFAPTRGDSLRASVLAAQVLLTGFDLATRVHYLNARQTLRKLLEWRAVPVVNENDTTATDEITFGDNDFLAAQVAIMLEARLLVLLTDTPGLHTADPRRDPGAELVPEVRDYAELEGYEIGQHTSPFGSGGMRSKVAAASMAGAAGIQTVICDGTSAGTLKAAAAGEAVGTRIHPHAETTSSFKLWLRYAKPAQGTVRVDSGAARVLRESGSSLLPVGVTEVDGEFEAGDAIEVAADGELIGKGIVNYSAEELRRIKGMRSDQVRELLPARLRGGGAPRLLRPHLDEAQPGGDHRQRSRSLGRVLPRARVEADRCRRTLRAVRLPRWEQHLLLGGGWRGPSSRPRPSTSNAKTSTGRSPLSEPQASASIGSRSISHGSGGKRACATPTGIRSASSTQARTA